MRVTRLSDIEETHPTHTGWHRAIGDAVREVLPKEQQVLPDGRAAHSVIAQHAIERYRALCGTEPGQPPS